MASSLNNTTTDEQATPPLKHERDHLQDGLEPFLRERRALEIPDRANLLDERVGLGVLDRGLAPLGELLDRLGILAEVC